MVPKPLTYSPDTPGVSIGCDDQLPVKKVADQIAVPAPHLQYPLPEIWLDLAIQPPIQIAEQEPALARLVKRIEGKSL